MTSAAEQEPDVEDRDKPDRWPVVAARQDQVLARRQALEGGLTPAGWEWRLARGVWQRAVPGVAVTHSGEPSTRQLCFAAVLHGGAGAALSGDAALVVAGFRGLGELSVLDVVVAPGRHVVAAHLASGPLIRPRRAKIQPSWQRSMRGLAYLKPDAAVLHAAAWAATDRAAEWRLAAAVQQRLTAVVLLRKALADLPRLPRRALINAVLDDVELGAHAASELDFLRFCRRNRLPEPDELQVKVRAGGLRYLDGRWSRQQVSLELDGTHHLEVKTWDEDALRSLHLVVAARGTGEQLIRLTRGNLRHDEAQVANLLRTLLC